MIANIGPAVHMDTQPAALAQLKKQEQVQQAVQEEKESTASGSSLPPNVDEYIPGEEPVSAGLYRQGTDENGNPKIIFDAPDEGEKAAGAPEKEEAQKCTVNTDKVDAEIKKLKKEKASIEKQLAKAGNDPIQQRKLYRELQQIEGELKMKDNDSYRKQHAEYKQG